MHINFFGYSIFGEIEIHLYEQQLDTFKYLGMKVHKYGKNDAEIYERIEIPLKLYYALRLLLIRKKCQSIHNRF